MKKKEKKSSLIQGIICSILETNNGSATTSTIRLRLKEFGFSDKDANKTRNYLRKLERDKKVRRDRPFGDNDAEIRWTLI